MYTTAIVNDIHGIGILSRTFLILETFLFYGNVDSPLLDQFSIELL